MRFSICALPPPIEALRKYNSLISFITMVEHTADAFVHLDIEFAYSCFCRDIANPIYPICKNHSVEIPLLQNDNGLIIRIFNSQSKT